MSGSPKYSRVELERRRQEELERKRRIEAEAEAKARAEAERREQQRQLEAYRKTVNANIQNALANIHQNQADLYNRDFQTLKDRLEALQKQVQRLQERQQLWQSEQTLSQIITDLNAALRQKRRDDAEKQRLAALEQCQFELQELHQILEQIPELWRQKFDADGQKQVQRALSQVSEAIAQSNLTTARSHLNSATEQVQAHRQRVQEARKHWQQRKAQAETYQSDLIALLAGLKTDSVVMRWQSSMITALESHAQSVQAAIANEEFETVAAIVQEAKAKGENAIAQANEAQIKAEKRDYVAESIARTLEAMGMNIVHQQLEHPDHPASAVILAAANNAGKSIGVSVPVEGEVYYDVEGYPKNTVAVMGGGSAPVCDEAEQVLNEMHDVLAEQFGIQMGEVCWEGKDPDRQLRKADSLPTSGRNTTVARN